MAYRVQYKKNKFGAKRQDYNGRWYHSKKEASIAEQLDWRLKAKELKDIKPQHKIELKVNDVIIGNYYIDFKCLRKDGIYEYIEVKGFETPEWQMKWKLLNALKEEILEPGAELIVIK